MLLLVNQQVNITRNIFGASGFGFATSAWQPSYIPERKMQYLSWLEFFKEELAVHGGHGEKMNYVLHKTAAHDMLCR